MRIGTVVGTVTLNRCLPEFHGARLKLVTPLLLPELARSDGGDTDDGGSSLRGAETLVAWDQLGAGEGSTVALSEGPEAAQPFRPDVKPLDTYVAAILDSLRIDDALARSFDKQDDDH